MGQDVDTPLESVLRLIMAPAIGIAIAFPRYAPALVAAIMVARSLAGTHSVYI